MSRIYIVTKEGKTLKAGAEVGLSIMQVIKNQANDQLLALCGGHAACGTCHVYVSEEWLNRLADPEDDELAMLDTLHSYKPSSRLSCQITFTPELCGLTLTIAPSE